MFSKVYKPSQELTTCRYRHRVSLYNWTNHPLDDGLFIVDRCESKRYIRYVRLTMSSRTCALECRKTTTFNATATIRLYDKSSYGCY